MIKKHVANLVCGLNLNVSQEWTGEINWFLTCWCKFTQIKRWLNIFWGGPKMGVDSLEDEHME